MDRALFSQPHALPPDAPQPVGLADLGATGRPRPPKGRSTRAAALRALVEDSDEGMILADEQGKILYANAASERFLGYRPVELVGRIGFDLCRREHLPVAREEFGRCLRHPGVPVAFQVDVRRRDGTFQALAVKLVNRLPAPGVKAVVVYFHGVPPVSAPPDLAADDREEQYRALFHNAPVGLGVADRDGTLLAFNDAILQPGGYTREDILQIGNVAQLYCHAADRERMLSLAQAQGFVWREEVQFRRKDGTCYDTLLSLTPVWFAGRQCWYATVEDITERKRGEEQRRQLEAQLRQAQKMEAVGRMTAGIAHDFNNILAIILATAELMAKAAGRELGNLGADLAELHAAAERGAVMVRKLLGFSRHAALKLEPTDLADVVDGLRAMIGHLAREYITLELRTVPRSVAEVDPAAVEQMVLNLVSNACDAMPGGGALSIDVKPIVLLAEHAAADWMTPGPFVCVSVTDTGVGMDERTQARVFEPFFTTKPTGVGTGLGLSMVYGLVKQQRGFVDVRSEVGKGTTVTLYFPQPHSEK